MIAEKFENMLTVDPGDNTGWAFWNKATFPEVGQLVNTALSLPVEAQLPKMWDQFDLLLTTKKPAFVIMEGVEVYAGSLKSRTASQKRSGQKIPSLFKLAFLIGGYCNVCDIHNIRFKIMNFSEWGGQMPPAAVNAQVKRINGKEYKTQHITDAVAMGFSIQGRIK